MQHLKIGNFTYYKRNGEDRYYGQTNAHTRKILSELGVKVNYTSAYFTFATETDENKALKAFKFEFPNR